MGVFFWLPKLKAIAVSYRRKIQEREYEIEREKTTKSIAIHHNKTNTKKNYFLKSAGTLLITRRFLN